MFAGITTRRADMNAQQNLGRSLGLAAAATLAAGLVGAVPADASPAVASVTVADNTLIVAGTNGPDRVIVDFTNPDSVGIDIDGDRQSVGRRTFTAVSVRLRSGDDRFSVVSGGSALTDEPLVIHGGNGDDDLRGGAGVDVLFGDRGDDFVNGALGTDTEMLGAGDDVAGWDPGQGSDAIFGQYGVDTLLFNGAGGDEVMSLSANGDRAVFLRSPGSIRMDLDDVERVQVNTLGGVDTVTVNDVSGTDVEETTIDLSVAGAGDTKADTVVVSGSPQADDVVVDASGGTVDVTGLRPETRITGSESFDRLLVNTLGGSDQVHVTDAATALIGILVDFGADQ